MNRFFQVRMVKRRTGACRRANATGAWLVKYDMNNWRVTTETNWDCKLNNCEWLFKMWILEWNWNEAGYYSVDVSTFTFNDDGKDIVPCVIELLFTMVVHRDDCLQCINEDWSSECSWITDWWNLLIETTWCLLYGCVAYVNWTVTEYYMASKFLYSSRKLVEMFQPIQAVMDTTVLGLKSFYCLELNS